MKINNRKIIPFTQLTDWDCAPTSLKMLMSYYKIPIRSEKRLLNSLNTRKDGTSANNIKRYLERYFELYEGNDIEEAKDFLKKKHVLYACINDAGKYSHYILIVKIGSKYVYYLDPNRKSKNPLTKKTINYFFKNWREYQYWFLAPIKKYKVKKYSIKK